MNPYRHLITFAITTLTLFLFTNFTRCNKADQQLATKSLVEDSPIKIGDTLSGKVISIVDGDTYDLLIKGNVTIRIRMEGIDAPEKGMPFYRVSKNYLAELCFQKMVCIKVNDIDLHDRYVAFTYLPEGGEAGHKMVRAGMAWHFVKYNKDNDLARLEQEARENKRGLWIDKHPMEPWRNRALHRAGISTKDSFNLINGRL